MIISFMCSHGGSSMKYIIKAIYNNELHAETGAIIVNNKESDAFAWALTNGFSPIHISSKTHPGKDREDAAIITVLQESKTDYVVLSGYMKKIGPGILAEFTGKILNIHPALLPKFGGKGMFGDNVHRAVLDEGEQYSGATVHFVNSEYDQGPVVLQKQLPLSQDETLETLREKVKGIEGKLYLDALRKILQDPIN